MLKKESRRTCCATFAVVDEPEFDACGSERTIEPRLETTISACGCEGGSGESLCMACDMRKEKRSTYCADDEDEPEGENPEGWVLEKVERASLLRLLHRHDVDAHRVLRFRCAVVLVFVLHLCRS